MTGLADVTLPSDLKLAGRGTTALMAALRSAVPQGSGVIVPVNLCAIAVAGIVWSGTRPVFHDVSSEHGNADIDHLEAIDTSGCTALLAVHNFGRAVDLAAFRAFADARGLFLLEDVCNALGATYDGTPLGRTGDAALYSFNAAKILDCGHGGAVYVRDPSIRARVGEAIEAMPAHSERHDGAIAVLENDLHAARRAVSAAAQREAFERYRPYAGFQAAPQWWNGIRRAGKGLASNVAHRREIAACYRDAITHPAVAHTPVRDGDAPWRYSILVPSERRHALLVFLTSESVPCSAWYPPVNAIFAPDDPSCYPGAERFAASVINLWTDPTTSLSDALRTSALVNQFLESGPG